MGTGFEPAFTLPIIVGSKPALTQVMKLFQRLMVKLIWSLSGRDRDINADGEWSGADRITLRV